MTPEKLAEKYNFCKIGDDGILEFYCDHALLSTIRACEAYFIETHTKHFRAAERNWNLDFGQWLHATLEHFYTAEYNKYQRIIGKASEGDSISKGDFVFAGMNLWEKMKMEEFDGHRNYKMLGGQVGAMKLLTDYWNVYGEGKERLKVVGIEVPFGREKEVPIIDNSLWEVGRNDIGEARYWPIEPKWIRGPFRAYLTGRFDQIIDDNISLAAFDHKSTAFFDGSEASKFMPHDGMQGYVYALNQLVKKLFPDKLANRMIINHICLQDKSNQKDEPNTRKRNVPTHYAPEFRFTRSTITYTPEQLEEYRLRQAATFDVLYQLLVLERPPQWNTGSCGDMYHKECPFKSFHSITPSQRDRIMEAQLKKVEEWNPFHESKAEVI